MKLSRALPTAIEYGLLRLLEALFRALPRGVALWLGGVCGRILYLAGWYRRVVRRNMEHVGLWSPEEQRRITRELYYTMFRYMADFLHFGPRTAIPCDCVRMDLIEKAIARNRGTLLVLGHFGNWEALASMYGHIVPALDVVAMPMGNGLVERWLIRKREATGAHVIGQKQAVRRILNALHANHLVAALIDQHARKHGTLVPFLGKPASTVRTVAGLVRRTGCSVLLVYGLMGPDNRYHVHVEEQRDLGIDPSDRDAYIDAYQKEHNDVLSSWIRQHPTHWFGWFHRRFRATIRYD